MRSITSPEAYFLPLGNGRYEATSLTGGAWNVEEQHIAPALGLLVHVLEGRADAPDLELSRLSIDIYGTIPVAEMETSISILRPGRTIELSEVTLKHDGRTVASLRGWSLATSDTTDLENSLLPELPPLRSMQRWHPTEIWPGGFIATIEGHRRNLGQGRAQAWLRTETDLVAGEEASALARYIGLIDVANGTSLGMDPRTVAFPNLDSTVSLFRSPAGQWVGLDVTQSAGPGGIGLTHTILHDEQGPVGALTQTLTLRRTPPDA